MADFTVEEEGSVACPSRTVPDSALLIEGGDSSKGKGSKGTRTASGGGNSRHRRERREDALAAAMRKGMADSVLAPTPAPSRTSPYERAVLAAIAEDAEMAGMFPDVKRGGDVTVETMSSVAARSKDKLKSLICELGEAQCVSLCFVVDTTGSMASHINGVKQQIPEIVKKVQHAGCKIHGLAFIGYKDWCDGDMHFEELPFTNDQVAFQRFVGNIKATGGGDLPEDVLGGLDRGLRLSWPGGAGARVLFHIGDAPPHGRQFYSGGDDFPDGHSRDRPLPELFRAMAQQGIDYYFGKMNEQCKKMISIFEAHLGKSISEFDVSDPASITKSVTRGVMDSVSLRSEAAGGTPTRLPPLDKNVPDWSALPLQPATIKRYKLPERIEDIVNMRPLEDKTNPATVQVAPRPFDAGGCRLAYYGRCLFNTSDDGEAVIDLPHGGCDRTLSAVACVFKQFIRPPRDDIARFPFEVDMETQTVAAKFAFEFNDRLKRTTKPSPIKLKYLMAKLVRIKVDGSFSFYIMEREFHDGAKIIKYTNNYGFVRVDDSGDLSERCQLAVAFSHFSYQHSGRKLLIADIQGVDTKDHSERDTMLLTDPAIHCPGAMRFGKTNLQQVGIDAFFKNHVCNGFCKALGLA